MKKILTSIILAICLIALQVYAEEDDQKEFEKTCSRLIEQEQFDRLISFSKEFMIKNSEYAPAYRFFVLGNYYGKKETDEVKRFLNGLLKGKPTDSFVHYGLGYYYFLQGELEISEKELRKSISLNPNIALAQNNLGAVLSRKGKLDEALVHIRKALQLEPGLEVAKNNLQNVLERKERPAVAESMEQLLKFIASALTKDDAQRFEQIIISNNHIIRENKLETIQICSILLDEAIKKELSGQIKLGKIHLLVSQTLAVMYKNAVDSKYLFDKVEIFRKWSKEEKEKYLEGGKLFGQGEELSNGYKYEAAVDFYNRSLSLYREIGYKGGEANSLLTLGNVHMSLSEYEKAGSRYEAGLVIFREIKDRSGEANCLLSLGVVHMSLSEYEQARSRYEAGLVIFREINHRLGEAHSLQSLGDVHRMLSEYEQARSRYEAGLVIFRKIKARLGEAHSLKSLGNVHRMLSEYEQARNRYEEALAIQKEILERQGMLWSYYRLGQTFEALKKYPEAEENYIKSIEVIEDVWEDMKVEEIKTAYFGSKVQSYERLITLLFNQGKGEAAFPFAERSKAKAFLYRLGNKRVDPKKNIPLKLLRDEEELRREITLKALEVRENEKREENRRVSSQTLTAELLQLKQKHGEIMERIKRISPEYTSLVSVNPLPVEEIQTLIRSEGNMVILEYYTTPEATFLWLLDGDRIYPHKIDITEDALDNKIREYHTMVSNTTFGIETLTDRAHELYDLLLKPVEPQLKGKTHIGVIPHGNLHYLPFETLMKNGEFLVRENTKIFYLPSASTYKYCKEKNKKNKEQLIAVGNPDGSLPFSEKEVEELKRLYPKDTEIFTGEDAKESRAKYYATYPDIYHFACHGSFNVRHPMYTALQLGPDHSDDGRLEVHEIFQLQLKPAYLVTLSACQTNLGGIQPGDEIIGLTRAFIYAGTSGILASLWKVDDYYTEKFMVAFYRALKNADKIEALHTARISMIENYGKKHPFYWAAFVLIGDPM